MLDDPSILANAKIAVGAAAGGGVRMFLRPARSITQAAMLMASCITCGTYGTWPLMDYLDIPVGYAGSVGALLGVMGLSIAEGALKSVDRIDFGAFVRALVRVDK